MSLQLIAKQMEAKGRKGDSMLVHMTPGEVEGLQKLAESMGGSLTINPETGLVEANFLKKLISSPLFAPLAGAGLMMIPGVGPMMAAGLVGGGTALATGDIGKGAMAGLGAYGGAGLAGGLMNAGNAAVSQAATAANPAVMGPMPGAASGFEAAKAGVSALGEEAGREAFMQGVGGVGGLAKNVGMAAAPLMASTGQKVAKAPTDDEMYYYEFTPGQTGKRSNSSTEELQFSNKWAPVRKIRASEYPTYAAQGGLLSYAEGGEATTTDGATGEMSGASKAAFDYLMGNAPPSADGLPALAAQAPASQAPGITVGGDNMYAFNPATGMFLRNPNYDGPSKASSSNRTSRGVEAESAASPLTKEQERFFDNESPLQREARMGEVQNLFNLGPTGAIFSALRGDEARLPDFGTMIGTSNLYKNLSDESMRSEGGRGGYDNSSDRGGYDPSRGDVGGEGGRGVTGTATGGMGPSSARAQGGLIGLAKGGMASGGFVVPADVVSALGNGSTDAGLRALNAMLGKINPIKGKGDGLSDSIPTHIDGKQPAKVADGEAYIDPKTVKRVGGAKKLYAMMDKIRTQAHGKTTQQRKVNPAKVLA